MESCSNNQRYYDVMCAEAFPYRDGGSQGGEGLGSQYRPNGWESESTCFHGPNVESCEIVGKVPDVDAGLGGATVWCGVDCGVGFGVGSSNEPHWA